jgi:hypothetical protein
MYVKVRTVDGKTDTVITISKLTSVEDFRVLVEHKLAIERGKQRLFYRGKQLEDGYRIFDYDVQLNDVIQLMIKSVFETPLSSSKANVTAAVVGEPSRVGSGKSELNVSKYYKVGDFVDVRIVSYDAWFESKIVGLLTSESGKIHSQMENGSRVKGPNGDSDIHSSSVSKMEQDEGSSS